MPKTDNINVELNGEFPILYEYSGPTQLLSVPKTIECFSFGIGISEEPFFLHHDIKHWLEKS